MAPQVIESSHNNHLQIEKTEEAAPDNPEASTTGGHQGANCCAQDVILSQSRDELMIGAQLHFERIVRWISLQHTMY